MNSGGVKKSVTEISFICFDVSNAPQLRKLSNIRREKEKMASLAPAVAVEKYFDICSSSAFRILCYGVLLEMKIFSVFFLAQNKLWRESRERTHARRWVWDR